MTNGLLRWAHFRERGLGRLDILEVWERAQAGWFGLTGAAAGRGQERENGSDECGENANHGVECGRFDWNGTGWDGLGTKELNPETKTGRLFGGLDVGRFVRRRSGAAGSGGEGGYDGDKDEFHLWASGWFVGDRHEAHASVACETSGAIRDCKAKDKAKIG